MNTFRQLIYAFTGLCLALLFLIACSEEDERLGNEGLLQLSLGFNSKTITVETKADTDTENCKVWIKNDAGDIIRKYEKATDIPAQLWLITGTYTVEASTGTPKTAEFDKAYYKGESEITIQANKTVKKEIVCRLAQSKVSVVYDEDLNTYYTDYNTTVSLGTSKLVFAKENTQIGYFYAPDGDKDLLCKVVGKNKNSEEITSEYTIANIKPYTHYIIHVNVTVNNPNTSNGGLKFTIETEEDLETKEDDIDIGIKKYPGIHATQDDVETTEFVFFEDPGNGIYTLKASAAFGIKEFIVNNPFLSDILEGKTSVNFMNLSAAERTDLTSKGFLFTPEPVKGIKELTVQIPVKTATAKEKKDFIVSVTDMHEQNRTAQYTMFISDMMVATDWHKSHVDAWATHAFLRGKWFPATQPSDIKINYKKTADTQWTEIPTNAITFDPATKRFFVKIDYPLSENGISYEYTVSEGGKTSSSQVFTTEAAIPLPNGNLDDWYHTGSFYVPNKSANGFWGTGNNSFTPQLTTPTESPVVTSGGKAAHLKSQSAPLVGLAAGNLFAGDFQMDGMGGKITMGRLFGSRPAKLKGFYRYAPGTIDNGGTITLPSGKKVNIVTGTPDTCAIYILMTSEPFTISTVTPSTLFDLDTQRFKDIVFAYAELPASQCGSTNGAYKSFELPLQYLKEEKPENMYMTIVCSADKYGDYFKGSSTSELFLDDFELIYE